MKALVKNLLCVGTLGLMTVMTPVSAQNYPTDPIKFVVPFKAGGGTDVVARIVAEHMTKELGQPVVVDNKPGANGIVGTKAGATANPDGYTLTFVLQATMALNPSLYKATNYDPENDFAAISQLASVPYVVVANPGLGVKTVEDLVAMAKAKPGEIDFASGASAAYLASLLFQKTMGIEMTHIPYPGSGPALTDVMGGRVNIMLSSPVSVLPHINSGKLVPLAVTSPQRVPSLPDVPTIAELGFPEFEVSGWYGMSAPKGTPKEVLNRLNESVQKALADEKVQASFAGVGVGVQGSTPEEFQALIASEGKRWSELIKEAGIEAQ